MRYALPLLIILLSAGCGKSSSSAVPTSVDRAGDERGFVVRVGDKAPAVTFPLTDGTKVSLSDLRGKVVMLQFTASWCSVCREEMPHIETEIWLPQRDKDFVLIGVDREEPLAKVIEFAQQTGITYPLALDLEGSIYTQFAEEESGVTRNVVIDRDGRIVFLTRLFDPVEFARLKEKIESLLVATD